MPNILIIKPGMFTTIQDGGRKGFAFYGVPRSGYLDRESARVANLLVGNSKNSSLIEMNYVGGAFVFSEDCVIAITGADMQPSIDGTPCNMYQTLIIKTGATLQFKNAIAGVRTYVAVRGKWKIPEVYNSTSTYTYGRIGGVKGRVLKERDVLKIRDKKSIEDTVTVLWPDAPDYESIKTITISKGPEFSFLKNKKQVFSTFSLGPQSDRMGAVLEGSPVVIQSPDNFKSKFLLPGMIQCTPSGKLIVVLQDGQTTGGYPRVGIISKKELNRFNQLKPGVAFKFVKS